MTNRLTIDQITSDGLDQLYDRLDRAEAALARIAALAEEYPVGIDTALIHEALALAEQPARTTPNNGADDGPSVCEAAVDDRRWFDVEKAGE